MDVCYLIADDQYLRNHQYTISGWLKYSTNLSFI